VEQAQIAANELQQNADSEQLEALHRAEEAAARKRSREQNVVSATSSLAQTESASQSSTQSAVL